VVDRQFLAAWLVTAILARVPIAFENVSAAERDGIGWNAVVPGKRDHFGNPKAKMSRPNAKLVFLGSECRPIGPVVNLVIGRIDDASGVVPYLDQRTGNSRYANGLPVSVQYECWSFQYG